MWKPQENGITYLKCSRKIVNIQLYFFQKKGKMKERNFQTIKMKKKKLSLLFSLTKLNTKGILHVKIKLF